MPMQRTEQIHPLSNRDQLAEDEIRRITSALRRNQEILTGFYVKRYGQKMMHDSPNRSRTEMATQILRYLRDRSLPNDKVLNICSGPRALEREIQTYARLQQLPVPEIFSLDIAITNQDELLDLQKGQTNKTHVMGNALALPYPDKYFGAVMSSHGIDFIPRPMSDFWWPYQEAARVLAPGGLYFLNCHHPAMVDLDPTIIKDEPTRQHWGYLKRNSILIESTEEAETALQRFDITITSIKQRYDTKDRWWEIIGRKN